LANSAFATNDFKETGGAWYTGASPGTKLAEGTTKSLTTTAVGENQTWETTIASSKVDITAKKVECKSCVIKNVGTAAKIDGTFIYRGMSVTEPVNCSISESIELKPETLTVGMNKAGTLWTYLMVPQSGSTIATVELFGEKCAIAGLYKLAGVIFGQAASATGVFGTTQEIKFSKTIQESAGEASSLKVGSIPAFVTGAFKATLAGATEWTAKEK
jgi:hypothetical protein